MTEASAATAQTAAAKRKRASSGGVKAWKRESTALRPFEEGGAVEVRLTNGRSHILLVGTEAEVERVADLILRTL